MTTAAADEKRDAQRERDEQRAQDAQERQQRLRDERKERDEQEQKNRDEARAQRNTVAAEAMEDIEAPEEGDVYDTVKQLTVIAENRHADANHALGAIAKALLGLIGKKLKSDPIHLLHGRNIIPGRKSDVPLRMGPEPTGETPSTKPEDVMEQRKDEYALALEGRNAETERLGDEQALADPRTPREKPDDTPGRGRPEDPGQPGEPGTPPTDPGRPPSGPGERPEHEPNPPQRRASDAS